MNTYKTKQIFYRFFTASHLRYNHFYMQNTQALKKTLAIIGLGRLGKKLALELKNLGYTVYGTTRSEAKNEAFQNISLKSELLNFPHLPSKELLEAEIVVLNIPPFSEIVEWQKKWPWNKNAWIIFVSSTSVYGQSMGVLTENDTPCPDTSNGQILERQEKFIKETFNSSTIIRLGGLLGENHRPHFYLSGKKNLPNPLAPVNLVHEDDAIGFVLKIIEMNNRNETFNLVCPEHRSRVDFYSELCLKHGLPIPEFDENDRSSGKLISGQKAEKIYTFKWPKKSL